jgi:hypothetical protein
MRPDDIRQELKRSPLGLIRFHLTDGAVFEVGHPDMGDYRTFDVDDHIAR